MLRAGGKKRTKRGKKKISTKIKTSYSCSHGPPPGPGGSVFPPISKKLNTRKIGFPSSLPSPSPTSFKSLKTLAQFPLPRKIKSGRHRRKPKIKEMSGDSSEAGGAIGHCASRNDEEMFSWSGSMDILMGCSVSNEPVKTLDGSVEEQAVVPQASIPTGSSPVLGKIAESAETPWCCQPPATLVGAGAGCLSWARPSLESCVGGGEKGSSSGEEFVEEDIVFDDEAMQFSESDYYYHHDARERNDRFHHYPQSEPCPNHDIPVQLCDQECEQNDRRVHFPTGDGGGWDSWHRRESNEGWGQLCWDQNRENQGDEQPDSLSPVQGSGRTGLGAGLSNLGNSCFMNAILQCFTHTVPFVEALRSSNHAKPCGADEFCVLCEIREHIEVALASSGTVVSPVNLFRNLNKFSLDFRSYQQEDAHEFLARCLEKIDGCCSNSNSCNWSSSLQDDSIVKRVFGGRLVSKLRCSICGWCSYKYDPVLDLSLEIVNVDSLQSAFESYTKVEKMEDSIFCENCCKQVSGEKQLLLDRVPTVAALHLKRFKYDGCFTQKIGNHVEFPSELDLKPYSNYDLDSNEDLTYQLVAAVVHNGFSPTSGHYFCYIRSSPDTWHKLDDSRITKSEKELVLSQAAYVLFYVRKGTLWFSSLMESQMLCSDLNISNTSPKSVLDTVDGGCTSCPTIVNIDNSEACVRGDASIGASSHLSCFPLLEAAKISGTATGDDVDGFSAKISSELGQNEPHFRSVQTKLDPPMTDILDVVDPLDPSGGHDGMRGSEQSCSQLAIPNLNEPTVDPSMVGVSGALSALKNDCEQGTHRKRRNGSLRPQPPPRSTSPQKDIGGTSGGAYCIPRDHLKVANRVNDERLLKREVKNSAKMEALRYIKKNGNATKRMQLMAALLPQSEKGGLRLPCKKASPQRRLGGRVTAMR